MNALSSMPYDQGSTVNVTAMPHNLEAEQALLGALMFDNGVFERLSDRLRWSAKSPLRRVFVFVWEGG